jgi:flagellar biosynthesis component FlhA
MTVMRSAAIASPRTNFEAPSMAPKNEDSSFVVITKGSGRIAEVAARFSLDAMPGKQMAIDADLSAGLIDEKTARSRRQSLEDESSFFGAMDGRR